MSNLRTSVVLDLTGNLAARAKSYGATLGNMASRGARSMDLLRRSALAAGRGLDAVSNRYVSAVGSMALAYKGAQAVMKSASLDKQLIRVRQTAGATKSQAASLRAELHAMSQQTGVAVDGLLVGFNNLVQSGLSWEASLATIKATNKAIAVTGAEANVLTSGLTVAAEAFGFDLTQPGLAVALLDKMTVGGRLGKAELEDLSAIFARVGINAKRAGLSFDDTLGFVEELSYLAENPDRLATLADSTLRLFTNQNYLRAAARATKVNFYDDKGQKRAAFDVLDDIAKKYKSLNSDLKRDNFIQAAFGDADLDTKKGLEKLLSGDSLARARKMSATIRDASGAIAADLPDSLNNAVDQTARLKEALGEAADRFAQPINDVVNRGIKTLLDDKKISGTEMLVGGAVTGAAVLGAAKLAGRFLLGRFGGKLKGGLGGLLGGSGKPIPVYVVNDRMSLMPGEYGGGWQGGGAGAKAGRSVSGRGGRLAAMRGAGKWAGRVGGGLALAGTAYDLYDAWTDENASTDAKVNASGRAVGGGLGGWGGAVAGAQLGALLGSVVPGIGTAIGAAVGGIGGGLAGAWAGGNLGQQLMEAMGFRDGSAAERPKADVNVNLQASPELQRLLRAGASVDQTGFGDVDVDAGPYMAGVGR